MNGYIGSCERSGLSSFKLGNGVGRVVKEGSNGGRSP